MATVPTCSPSLWIDLAQLAGPQRRRSKDQAPTLNSDTHRPGETLCIQLNWPWEHNLRVYVNHRGSQYSYSLFYLTLHCVFIAFVLNYVPILLNEPPLSWLSSRPWLSWPISICLHQSYPLTLGLDSSMPATLSSPLYPAIYPSLSAYVHLLLSVVKAHLNDAWQLHWLWSLTVNAHKERARHFPFIAFYVSGVTP